MFGHCRQPSGIAAGSPIYASSRGRAIDLLTAPRRLVERPGGGSAGNVGRHSAGAHPRGMGSLRRAVSRLHEAVARADGRTALLQAAARQSGAAEYRAASRTNGSRLSPA